MPESAKVKQVRREYVAVKKLRNTVGKKARNKPKTSKDYKNYKEVNKAYKQIGQQLGRLTGLKPRRK